MRDVTFKYISYLFSPGREGGRDSEGGRVEGREDEMHLAGYKKPEVELRNSLNGRSQWF
jgi:hypothetical protein